MTRITVLPTELIIQIIQHNLIATALFSKVLQPKSNKKELLSYCLVNRFWRSIAQVELFRCIDLFIHQVPGLIKAIQGTELSLSVRRVRFSKPTLEENQLIENSHSETLSSLFRDCRNIVELQLEGTIDFELYLVATWLPNLLSLSIENCSIQYSVSSTFTVLENLVVKSIGEDIFSPSNFNSTTFPSLTSLYAAGSTSSALLPALLTFNKPLKHLAISELTAIFLTASIQNSEVVIEAVQNLQLLSLLTNEYQIFRNKPPKHHELARLSKTMSSLKCLYLHPFPALDFNRNPSPARLEIFSEIINSCSSNLQLLLCSHMDRCRSKTCPSKLKLGESWQGENCWKKEKLNGFERGYTVKEIKDDSPESFWSVVEDLKSKYELRVCNEKFREDFIKEQVITERRRTQFWGLREVIARKIFRDYGNRTIYFIGAALNKLVQLYLSSLTLYTLYKSYFTTNELSKGIFLDLVQRFDFWCGVILLGSLSLVEILRRILA